MPRLIVCSGCSSHVLSGDSACPHCGAPLRTTGAARVPVVLMGLALSGCPLDDAEPAYGVAVSETGTSGTTTTSDGSGSDTEAQTEGGTTADTGSGSGSDSSSGTGGSGTAADSGDTTAGEPDYGVPTTSG